MSTPPPQPDSPEGSIGKQIDELLVEVEPAEAAPAVPQDTDIKAAEDAEIAAMFSGPAADASPPEPAPTTPETDPVQSDLIAALSTSMQSPAVEPEQEQSTEQLLGEEIAALMGEEPTDQAAEEAFDDSEELDGSFETPQSLAEMSQATTPAEPAPEQADDSSIEDQIAMEIENLLAVEENQAASAQGEGASSIDDLDKMLAQEIDADDELAGEFQSVEDVTAGIEIAGESTPEAGEEHAATARDVAAELDDQPEDLPHTDTASPEAVEKELSAVVAKIADRAAKRESTQAATQRTGWERWLRIGQEQLLNACYHINWPARRFLSKEWRETLGMISLIVAGTSALYLLAALVFF